MMKRFSRYRVLGAKLTFMPAVGSTVGGYVALGSFMDTEDRDTWYAGAASGRLNVLVSSGNTSVAPLWKGCAHTVRMPLAIAGWSYSHYANSGSVAEDREETPVSVAWAVTGPAATPAGMFRVEWDLEFAVPVGSSINP